MSLLANVRAEGGGDVPILVVEGEIDSSNAGEIGERVRRALTNHGMTLIVDLTPTTYIDSAGLNVLFRLAVELRERQQQMRLVVAEPSPIARMVSMVGLNIAVPTYPTREASLADLG
jgi:anti-anti-sigma factor